MTEEDWSRVDAILKLALNALSLSTANTLLLHRQGLLPDDEAAELAGVFREAAHAFEAIGNDDAASRLWTAAATLEARRSGR